MKSEKEKTRVTYIIDRLRVFAGTEKHLYQLISLADKESFFVNIITFDCFDEIRKTFENAGVDVHVIEINKILSARIPFKIWQLAAAIKKHRPHIVQTFHFTSDTVGVIAARLAGVPVIVSSRRDMGDLKKSRQIAINKLVNPFIDRFIAVCDRLKKNLPATEGIPAEKISTIYNGVELNRYITGTGVKLKARERLGIAVNAFVVGIVCVFRPEKDVLLFFNAISEISESISDLIVLAVGTGPNIDDLKKYTVEASLSDKVVFTGYVNDVREYIQAMDLVCLTPKENEGLSNAILEEMALGKPVIATDVGGNAELVVDGIGGYIIKPGDRDALADAIIKLYRDDKLRESMGTENRKRIEQYFTTEIMIRKLGSYYDELVREYC